MKVKLNKKKTTVIIFLILTVVICGNAFAALTGAPNIFFAIKNMMIQNEIRGEEELLVDRDITISYYPIKIKDGVELQVNRIFIEETKSTLFISLNNKNNDDEQLGINVYDLLENNNTKNILNEEKFLIQKGMKRNFEIELDKKVSADEKLLLEIIIGGKSVDRNVIVDLASKEIIIEGKEEVKKISEVELKRYLGCFSVLNYENLKMNDRLIYVAERMNTEIFKDEIETNSQRELFMNIIDSFYNGVYTTEMVNEIEIIKANKQQYFYDENSDTYPGVTDGAQLPRGLCLGIEDISYKSGIYTVEFIYVFPTLMDLEENRIEELEQYKATIELELNENTEYSKYKVVNLGNATVVKEQEKIESNVSEAFATKESDCEKLLDRYLKIYFNLMQNALNLPVDLGLADKHDIKLYELVEFQGENDAFYNTGIDYSKYEEAMSKYMTKKCMDIHFSAYTNDINDTLYVLATGGSETYYEVTEFELDSKNGDVYNYKGKIITYAKDHLELTEYEKTPKNMEVEIKKVDDKFLISNVIIDYTDYTEKNDDSYIEDTEKLDKEMIVELENINENKLKDEDGMLYLKENLDDSESKENTSTNATGEKLIQFDNLFFNIEEVAKEYRECRNIKNYKDFEYDFDGDGKKDKVTIKHKNENSEDAYEIKFNGENFIDASPYLYKVYIVDLNENDKNLEVVIDSNGPSDDPMYIIYSQKGNKMERIDTIMGSDLKTDKQGTILVEDFYNGATTPEIYFDYHFIKDGKITKKDIDLNKINGKEFKLETTILYFSEDFDNLKKLYKELELNDEAFEKHNIENLSENTTFKILKVEKEVTEYEIEEYKIHVELSNGQKGYIFHVQLAG